MRATLVSIAIVACAGTTNAGTIFQLPAYEANGDQIIANWNAHAPSPTWSVSLEVFREYYTSPPSLPDGPSETPPQLIIEAVSSIDPFTSTTSDVIANPQIIPGLPAGFNVVAVSADFMWATNSAQLYHVPEPSALTMSGLAAALVALFALCRYAKRQVAVQATIWAVVFACCAARLEAGTIFPSLDTYEANGDQIVAYFNHAAPSPTWSVSLEVVREWYTLTYDPTGPSEGPPQLNTQALTPDGTTIYPTWLSDVIATPQLIPGLPDGFNVVAVSSDYMWATNGSELYHVPEPRGLVMAAIGGLLAAAARLRKGK
jgi:hypothetical protein